mgnify:CR=1 FL=1
MGKRIGIGYSFKEQTTEKENEELKKKINELNLKLSKKEAKGKKEEKAKTITEDDAKDGLDQIQKLTDKKIKQIDELKAVKEKDVLEV